MSSQGAEPIELDFLPDFPVIVQQHEGQLSSDAGLLPIAQLDRRLSYTARMGECLNEPPSDDPRQEHRKPQTQHQRIEMLRQRLFGILAGYEDCNDHDTLRTDPVFKMIVDRLPGTVHASLGAEEDLTRIVNALRKERPDIQIHVRADGGFGLPRMYEVCEENGLTYTFGFSTNPRLKKSTEPLMQQAVEQHEQSKQKQRIFNCFQYKCDSWPFSRTVITKVECHDGGTNQRFVVTNRLGVASAEDAQREYDDYVQRGESEQRMDELKNGLHMDRLSCHRFMANFFRLLLHVAAMNLLGAMRQSEQLPQGLQVAQPCTWRTMLIKVAAVVVQTPRRIVVKVSANWPWWPMYQAVATRSLSPTSNLALIPPSS